MFRRADVPKYGTPPSAGQLHIRAADYFPDQPSFSVPPLGGLPGPSRHRHACFGGPTCPSMEPPPPQVSCTYVQQTIFRTNRLSRSLPWADCLGPAAIGTHVSAGRRAQVWNHPLRRSVAHTCSRLFSGPTVFLGPSLGRTAWAQPP